MPHLSSTLANSPFFTIPYLCHLASASSTPLNWPCSGYQAFLSCQIQKGNFLISTSLEHLAFADHPLLQSLFSLWFLWLISLLIYHLLFGYFSLLARVFVLLCLLYCFLFLCPLIHKGTYFARHQPFSLHILLRKTLPHVWLQLRSVSGPHCPIQ